MLILKGWARSVTEASPDARRARIARRVGSARAENVEVSWSDVTLYLTYRFNNLLVKYSGLEVDSQEKDLG
jgi:hypothetical protein